MLDIVEGLFGSREKARIIRFFLLNNDEVLTVAEIAEKNKLRSPEARKALMVLQRIRFVNTRMRKRKRHYSLNKKFPFYTELYSLVVATNKYPQCRSLRRIRSIGDVKLLLVSGTFLNYDKSKIDMMIVANHVSKAKLNSAIAHIEAEIGKEVRYVLMESEEFSYRMEMLDRFLIHFLEGPYEEIINKISEFKRFVLHARKK